MHYTALPSLLQHCQALPWHMLRPRLQQDEERLGDAWADHLSNLHEFASHGYYGLDIQDLDTNSQLRAHGDWRRAAVQAISLLNLAYSRGLPPIAMEGLFEHVLHWCNEYATFIRSTQSGPANGAHPINPKSSAYPATILLVALPVLLDRQELIPGILERLLGDRCDRLLDYLSAAACDKQEASELVFCPKPYGDMARFFDQPEIGAEPLKHYLHRHYGPGSYPTLAALGRLVGMGDGDAQGWAWEVAALVVLYGLDDRELQQLPGYPSDLVTLARQRLAQNYPLSRRA